MNQLLISIASEAPDAIQVTCMSIMKRRDQ